ncbi:hypothetical protein BYT27DRAFT_7188573 [Phlegmacium glaucopus]|nr:hypothetical protein BYT27DRAFT_7188573 [Phlegmacium glaucopus]
MSIWGNDAGNFVKFIAIIKKKACAGDVVTSMTMPKFVHVKLFKSNIVKCIKTGDCTSMETSKRRLIKMLLGV